MDRRPKSAAVCSLVYWTIYTALFFVSALLLPEYSPFCFFAAMGMLKEEVENLSELDQYAELLVHLLCAVPGWSEKNVQVCFHNLR